MRPAQTVAMDLLPVPYAGQRTLFRFAHRGASGHAPENTLAAIRQALRFGVEGIELDVRLVEGVPVLYHGRRLEERTNGHGYISEAAFENLRSLDAGQGQRIPTLREALDLIDRRCRVNLELKGPGTGKAAVRVIRYYVEQRGWAYTDFLLSSFDQHELLAVRQRLPSVPLGLLLCGLPLDHCAQALKLGAESLHLSVDFIDPAIILDAHAHGLKVHVYTVNDTEDAMRLQAMGVDGIFSDFPERFAAMGIPACA